MTALVDRWLDRLSRRRGARWWGAVIGLAMGALDGIAMAGVGVTFSLNGRDVSVFVPAYYAVSFAIFGYFVGYGIEARRRDKVAAALIQSQTDTINAVRARLLQSEKLAALGQLAATVAHEVRNPLAVIRSAAQGIGEGLPEADAEAQRACSFITAEADRLSNVVNSLLAFARPLQVHPRPVRVQQLFEQALLVAGPELAAKQVRTHADQRAAGLGVQVDPDLLSQVLVGLLANAAEAVPRGGEVGLSAYATPEAVEIEVTDSGPGIPVDLRARVFEPFFTTRARGVGLGLPIARQIVEAHGGRLDVGERAGGGARFTIRLPGAIATAVAA
jgi:signal transduction histidine kinase